MSADCCGQCHVPDPHRGNQAYRRVLWAVLAINAVMFLVEIGAGVAAGSASLQADALDFLGDAANYVISLLVVGLALQYRATAALAKACTMGRVRPVGGRHRDVARGPRDASERLHHGDGRRRGAAGKRRLVRAALGLPRRRCQYAFGLGLHPQRRARQSRRASGRSRRVRHRFRLA